MRDIKYLVVHCTATPQNTKIESIQHYWKAVLKWDKPGYHFLITADGEAHNLLPISEVSNGVAGHNANSIHISYVGGVDKNLKALDNRTPAQKETILRLLTTFKSRFTKAIIQGHRDFSDDKNHNGIIDPWERMKECPCFDAKIEYANL